MASTEARGPPIVTFPHHHVRPRERRAPRRVVRRDDDAREGVGERARRDVDRVRGVDVERARVRDERDGWASARGTGARARGAGGDDGDGGDGGDGEPDERDEDARARVRAKGGRGRGGEDEDEDQAVELVQGQVSGDRVGEEDFEKEKGEETLRVRENAETEDASEKHDARARVVGAEHAKVGVQNAVEL